MRPYLAKLTGGGAGLMLGQVGLMGLAFAQNIVATRWLGPETFGVWALLLSFSTLVTVFLSFRTTEALTSFWVEARRDQDPLSRQLIFSGALYAELATKTAAAIAIVCFGGWVLRRSHVEGAYVPALMLCALAKLLGFADPLWFSIMRDERRIRTLALLPVLVAAAQLGLMAALAAFTRASLTEVAASLALSQGLALCLKAAAVSRSAGPILGRGGLVLTDRRIALVFRESPGFVRMMWIGYLSGCLSSLMKELDSVAIGLVAGARDVGFYRVAKSLVGVLQTGAQSIAAILFQDFAELHAARDASSLQRFVLKFAPLSALSALVVTGAGFVLIEPLVALVYGPEFHPAVLLFRILLCGVGVSLALVWVSPLLVMLRRNALVLWLNLVNFAVFAGALALGVRELGGLGPAVAVSVAWGFGHVLGLGLSLWLLRRPPAPARVAHP